MNSNKPIEHNQKMNYEYPENFARFYDTFYQHLRDGVDNVFFLNHILNTKGRILEIGVGTGRFFIDALREGADIFGIDISNNMLNILKGKLDEDQHYRISNQSIVDFSFDDKFDLIIAPFRVIMHVFDKNDQIKSLNNIYKHLNIKGKFIFDTFVPDLRQLADGLNNVTDFEGEYKEGKKLKRIVSSRTDLINQIINVYFRMEWEEDNETRHGDWELPLRFFFRYELEHLIERSSFNQYEILGDYDGNILDDKSKEFIIVCNK
jgi:SAM-dependent methyltransferase